MSQIEQQLKRIQNKLQELLKQHTLLLKENQQLKKDLSESNSQQQQQRQNIEELKQRVNVLQLSNGEMNSADKKEFEKRINGMIKEIERCITILGE
ncbi:MAG: hypothetical protein JST23_08600 [Bacteroidetes bacterium]|nr:hypothetical protein [Bacteroidota bacterium]